MGRGDGGGGAERLRISEFAPQLHDGRRGEGYADVHCQGAVCIRVCTLQCVPEGCCGPTSSRQPLLQVVASLLLFSPPFPLTGAPLGAGGSTRSR